MSVQRNQADEFEKLIEPYERKLYLICLHMTGNDADAQDCAQEVILHAFRAYGRFRRDAKFSTWIFRIANNVCIDALRKRHGDASLDEMRQGGFDVVSDQPTAYELMTENDRKEKIRLALARIPAKLRIALILRDFESLSYEEISASLKIPPGTVKSRINRAREILGKILLADTELITGRTV
jgi:RNA polymerase sigma-70 factor, ECF subfamily